MKRNLLFSLMVLAAGPLLAVDSSPKDTVTAAAAALGEEASYAWHSDAEVAGGGGGRYSVPTDGKTEKDGYTWISMVRDDTTTQVVLKGTNGAISTPDSGWQSFKEITTDNGGGFNPTVFLVRNLQNYKTPAQQAAQLANQTATLKAGTNGISGELTEDGAKTMFTYGRSAGANAPKVTNPNASVTFWVADGRLVKYSFHVTGTVSFNSGDRNIDRTTTVEIKDVDKTKIEVPDDAKKKLE